MRHHWLIPRRTVLRGLGAALALPLLETMGWADPPKGSAFKPPVRLGCVNLPHGNSPAHFWPSDDKVTASGPLPRILEPLRPLLGDVLILKGLANMPAAGSSAPHGREYAAWLTGYACKQNSIENAISLDQIIAQRIGIYTALPSLELGTRRAAAAGDCEKGWSCAYYNNISWRSPSQPAPKESSPRAVLERMFSTRRAAPARGAPVVDAGSFAVAGADPGAGGGPARSLDQSMLDIVLRSAQDLRARISGNDQRKLDEYLDGVRQLETRIQAIERQQREGVAGGAAKKGYKSSPLITVAPPAAEPERFSEHVRLMLDLMILAFQSDTTRVATLMFGQANNGAYPESGVAEDHHNVSHFIGDAGLEEKCTRINVFHMQQVAYLLSRMKGLVEGPGVLLDNCMMLCGSGMGHPHNHNFIDLPCIVAGRGGGTIATGRYVKQAKGNHCDLLLALSARMGCPLERIGDSTRMLPDLSG